MNNLICVFFGHKDDRKLLGGKSYIDVVVNNIIYAHYRRCKRCKVIFFQSPVDKDGDIL